MSAGVRWSAAGALIALTIAWGVSQGNTPEPVTLPPVHVPRPIPEHCGIVFGDVWCWDPALTLTPEETP